MIGTLVKEGAKVEKVKVDQTVTPSLKRENVVVTKGPGGQSENVVFDSDPRGDNNCVRSVLGECRARA